MVACSAGEVVRELLPRLLLVAARRQQAQHEDVAADREDVRGAEPRPAQRRQPLGLHLEDVVARRLGHRLGEHLLPGPEPHQRRLGGEAAGHGLHADHLAQARTVRARTVQARAVRARAVQARRAQPVAQPVGGVHGDGLAQVLGGHAAGP